MYTMSTIYFIFSTICMALGRSEVKSCTLVTLLLGGGRGDWFSAAMIS
jgi:hypothetical protein